MIECKVLRESDHRSLEGAIERGVEHTLGYMDPCGGSEGHLVAFDHRGKMQGSSSKEGGKRWENKGLNPTLAPAHINAGRFNHPASPATLRPLTVHRPPPAGPGA